MFVGKTLGKIQFLLYSTGFQLVADQISLSTHRNTHTIVSANNKRCQQRPAQGHHNLLSILWSIQIPIYSPNYNTTRVYNLNSQSFFFFERNQNRDDTAFENCSCLATWSR